MAGNPPPVGYIGPALVNRTVIPRDKIEPFRVPYVKDTWTLNGSSKNWQLVAYTADAVNAFNGHNGVLFESYEWNINWVKEYLKRQLTTPLGFMVDEADSRIYGWIFSVPIRAVRAMAIKRLDADTAMWCDRWLKTFMFHQACFHVSMSCNVFSANDIRTASVSGGVYLAKESPLTGIGSNGYFSTQVGMRSVSPEVPDMSTSWYSDTITFLDLLNSMAKSGFSSSLRDAGLSSGVGLTEEERILLKEFISSKKKEDCIKLINLLCKDVVSKYEVVTSYRENGQISWMPVAASHSTEPLAFAACYGSDTNIRYNQVFMTPSDNQRTQKNTLTIEEFDGAFRMKSNDKSPSCSSDLFGKEIYRVIWDKDGHRVAEETSPVFTKTLVRPEEYLRKSNGKYGRGSTSIFTANFMFPTNDPSVFIIAKGGGQFPWGTESFFINHSGHIVQTSEANYNTDNGELLCYRTFWDYDRNPGLVWLMPEVFSDTQKALRVRVRGYAVFNNVSGTDVGLPTHVKPFPVIQHATVDTIQYTYLLGNQIIREDTMNTNMERYTIELNEENGIYPYVGWSSFVNGDQQGYAKNDVLYRSVHPFKALCMTAGGTIKWVHTSGYPAGYNPAERLAERPIAKFRSDDSFFDKLVKGAMWND